MEVVLLWLDDLDDVAFSIALLWERWRRIALQIGLAASFALAGSELFAIASQWASAFSAVAAGGVGAWILGAAMRAYYYRHGNEPLTPA